MARDITGLVSGAADLAIERLEIKLEHDSYYSPGERSYSDEDVARMEHQMEEFTELMQSLSDARVIVLNKAEAELMESVFNDAIDYRRSDDDDEDGDDDNRQADEYVKLMYAVLSL